MKYDESSISVLRGVEAIRKKAAMYIGGTDNRGLHHILYEVIDNATDESLEGYGNRIIVTLEKDNILSVEDFGRGIPCGIHPEENVPTIDLVMTELHAGGKFHTKTYATSGGTHGVGVKTTNALSEWMEVTVHREGKKWERRYKKGTPVPKNPPKATRGSKNKSGTKIRFLADKEIFKVINFKPDIIKNRLKELSYLLPNVEFIFINERDNEEKVVFKSKLGIQEFILEETGEYAERFPTKPIYFKGKQDNVSVEFAFIYTDSDREDIRGYANNIYNVDGGVHITGFKNTLTRIVNKLGRDNNILKEKENNLSGEEVRNGIFTVISIYVPQPQFEGQTKTQLRNADVEGIVSNLCSEFLEKELKNGLLKRIIDNALVTRKAKDAAKRAREIVRKNSGISRVILPGKLVDCKSNKPDNTELFIVEGDSAAGPAKQARDSNYQAVMPIRGKSLNVEKASISKILKNEELNAIISAVGCGIHSDTNSSVNGFNLDNLRYGKICLLMDADYDGYHIRTLLLTFIFRYMRPLLENGNVYVVKPPLYCIKDGKSKAYYYSEAEMQNARKSRSARIKRFKGLGEQNCDELKETCMDPRTRKLIKVKIDDIEKLDNIVSILMGSDVEARKEFIFNNASNYVEDF